MQGTVDRVVPEEGFGFIIGPNGEEYFFHRSGLQGVAWEELGPKLTSDRFTVDTVGRRLATLKKDPWADFFKRRQKLRPDLLKLLQA